MAGRLVVRYSRIGAQVGNGDLNEIARAVAAESRVVGVDPVRFDVLRATLIQIAADFLAEVG